ncbi:hypothetical protein VNI00_016166 [Paramarasmius palmivorus]|uniref:Uncharacterized protein n=1 Tax=Paramarasmius palmivorus TaxID=297713 RepID=A0AAW0BG16_9AGAR
MLVVLFRYITVGLVPNPDFLCTSTAQIFKVIGLAITKSFHPRIMHVPFLFVLGAGRVAWHVIFEHGANGLGSPGT